MDLNTKTIFINLGAYNEIHLDMMIKNCLKNASYPARVRIGLFIHDQDGIRQDLSHYKDNLKVSYFDYPAPLGCCVGREMAHAFYNSEDYYMQLDAHMLFEKDWDVKVINSFETLKKKYPKPIISYYVPWWCLNHNGTIKHYSSDKDSSLNGPMNFDIKDSFRAKYPKPGGVGIDWSASPTKYIEHHQIAGHFIFSDPEFFDDVRPDTTIMFAPEESLLALRAWTRGYRIFAISSPIVWHLNKGLNNLIPWKRRPAVFKDDILGHHYFNKNHKALKKARDIFTGKYFGYWGAPNKELLDAYQKAAGLDYYDWYEKLDAMYPNDPPEQRML
jgi:hypothetical protein